MTSYRNTSNDLYISRKPLRLLKSVSYPTFQLHATLSNRKIDINEAYKILILETLSWLRKRFREIEIPSEIMFPEPEKFESVNEHDFKSFRISQGYVLEVVSIKDKNIWSLCLTEPDLGPDPGNLDQERKPVPGRIFQTNVAFAIHNGQLECGFKTVCSEPEGTKIPCEVFRLAVVKSIVRNKRLGLKQFNFPIIEESHYIEDGNRINELKKFINNLDRQIPIVIIAEYIPKKELMNLDQIHNFEVINSKLDFRIQQMLPKEEINKKQPKLPFDAESLIRNKMAYAHFAIIPQNEIENYNKIIGSNYIVSEGDVRIIYPKKFDEDSEIKKINDINTNAENFIRNLDKKLQEYPKGKNIDFGNVKFLDEARIIEKEDIINKSTSKEEIIQANAMKIDSIEKTYQSRINNLKYEIMEKNNAVIKFKSENESLRNDQKSKEKECNKRIEEIEKNYNKKTYHLNNAISNRKLLIERPQRPCDVAIWVDKHFSEKLIFHNKAIDLMKKIPADAVEMNLICDAIEFLACEYRDYKLDLITEEEKNNICEKKYFRPFDVCPSGDGCANKYPGEYKIKYGNGYNGKPVEVPLNLHLKVGKNSDNLLRIYFLFDSSNKKVVIGSLPKHLPTTSRPT